MVARLTAAALPLALAALGGSGLAIVGARLRLLSPLAAFGLFFVALAGGGSIALVLGVIGVARSSGADASGRGAAILAGAIGLGCIAFVAVLFAAASGAPAIHDITTDVNDPPVFVEAARNEANEGRDLSYPNGAEDTPRLQRVAYPDLNPITVDMPAGETLEAALEAAEALGWKVVARDGDAGTFEAEHETSVFRFIDDVVVRVRPLESGSVVDVRSTSRVGVGDTGVNAERIRWFRDALVTGRR
jgi:uncharacterized protein (DUF1499 family)